MGALDFFRRKALVASPEVLEAVRDQQMNLRVRRGNQEIRNAWLMFQSASYGFIYSSQPAVRKVVDYIASNIAQVKPKLYQRIADDEREPKNDSAPAEVLRSPNPWTPCKQFIFDVFADFLVYNNAYMLKVRPDPSDRVYLLACPASAVGVLGTGVSQVSGYNIYRTDGSYFFVPPEDMIHWRGYNASDRAMGLSKLETLRADLSEQAASQRANVDLMESGLQQRGYIKRPLDAPDWAQDGGRDRFLEAFRKQMKKADRGYPILEEGMEIAPLGVSPKDAQMLQSKELFNSEVSSQYGMLNCPPTSDEERLQFYNDVAEPLASAFCDCLYLSLLKEEFFLDDHYFDFDFDEKKMSDAMLQTLTSAAGAPILTRNEARAHVNKPPKDGGDELITPLNVAIGGKPSVDVMPPQNPLGPLQDGSAREEAPFGSSFDLLETKDNWIEQTGSGHLPDYIGRIAKHLQEKGMTESRAIATAVNAARKMCRTGDVNFPGVQSVNPASRAQACAAVAEWDARRAQARASSIEQDTKLLESGDPTPQIKRDVARQARRVEEAQELLLKEFQRQFRSVKDRNKFDRKRWDNELAKEIGQFLERAFALEGAAYVSYLGGSDFDMAFVENYVKAAAISIAENLNDVTEKDIHDVGVTQAFEKAFNRADGAGKTIGVRATVRARNEAARQSPHPERRRKIWVAKSERHSSLDGKAVPLSEDWDGIEPGYEYGCGCTQVII